MGSNGEGTEEVGVIAVQRPGGGLHHLGTYSLTRSKGIFLTVARPCEHAYSFEDGSPSESLDVCSFEGNVSMGLFLSQ
jgi:hypothetical protein